MGTLVGFALKCVFFLLLFGLCCSFMHDCHVLPPGFHTSGFLL